MVLSKVIGVFLFLQLFVANAAGEKAASFQLYGQSQILLYGCNTYLGNAATFCPDMYPLYCGCSNPTALSSMVGCLENFNAPDGSYKLLMESCQEYYSAVVTEDQIKNASAVYKKSAKYASEIPGFNFTKPISTPLKTNMTAATIYIKCYGKFMGNYTNSFYYGSGLLGYWALVFLVAGIVNWSKLLFPGVFKKLTGPISNTWRKYVTLPALFNSKKSNDHKVFFFIHYLIPSRMEGIIIAGFAILTIISCAAQITYYEGDPIFEKKHLALYRYLADRTGIIVVALMPLIILLAGRNNFLQWLVRWKYSSFVTYHKWIARIVFVLLVLHSACFTAIYVEGMYYKESVKIAWFYWGIIGTISCGILMGQAIMYLRRNLYELFLLIHIIFAALFVAGGWIHVEPMGYINYYYATVAVWCFDRVVRILRICLFGFPKAEVKLYCNDCLKVTVSKPKYWAATPGAHAFIHFLRPTCFWQSHPFTFTVSSSSDDKIVLYCKVKGGITHGLYKYLSANPGHSANIRVALEGPYGGPTPARKYDTAVFVAGGNGIPGIYSEVYDLASKTGSSSKQLLKLEWIIRSYDAIIWFYDELAALKDTRIQTTIYITKPEINIDSVHFKELNFDVSDSDENSEKRLKIDKQAVQYEDKNEDGTCEVASMSSLNSRICLLQSKLSHIEFKEFRPSMDDMVATEITESNGSICFITCGHPQMVDDMRRAVLVNLSSSQGKRVDFYEQLQVWA